MRHRVAHRKLGRVTEHRIAMLRSQASALIEHERIETTVARAKELRPFVERIISVAKRSLKNTAGGAIGNVNARRTVATDIFNREVVTKLFAEIAPRYADRSGGYTRMMRLGRRRGDDAEIAQVELIGSEFDPAAEVKKTEGEGGEEPTRKRTIGERVRALGGGKKAEKTKAPKAKTSKGAGRKITAPRKAGGA